MATRISDDGRFDAESLHDTDVNHVGIIEDLEVTSACAELVIQLCLMGPVVLTSALEFFPESATTILAGHIDSPNTSQYVAALALSNIFKNISSYSVGFGFMSALDTLCSQAHGAQQTHRIGIYFQSGVFVTLALLFPVFLINWYSSSILLLLGQDPDVTVLAQSYSRYVLLGIPFNFAYELVRRELQAQGIVSPLVAIAAMGNVVAVAMGYWLAFHTSMGFLGLALANALGYIVMPLLLVVYFSLRPHHLSQWWCGWNLREAKRHVGLFVHLGGPGMVMLLMEWGAFEVLSLLAGVLPNPVTSMSAHTVVLNVTELLYMVFMGVAVAATIRVGNCIGAGKTGQAQLASKVALSLTLSMAAVLAAVMLAAHESIPLLFIQDPASARLAGHVLQLWAVFAVVEALNCVAQGIFRGVGKQKVAARTNAVAYYLVAISSAAFVAFVEDMGLLGLWLGFGIGICSSAGTLLFLMARRWKWSELTVDPSELEIV